MTHPDDHYLLPTQQGIDAFVGYGTAVVRGSPMSLNLGVKWVNPGATQYFINGKKINPTTSGFSISPKGDVVPKGDNKTDHFKNQGFEAFNALKGDCWINNPKALLGDDDEEMYDDDATIGDDDFMYDDDLEAGGASVMALGDDDRCVCGLGCTYTGCVAVSVDRSIDPAC